MAHSLSDRKNPILVVDHVSYSYHTLHGETRVLEDISFSVFPGEFIAIVGPSGCGNGMVVSWKESINFKDSPSGIISIFFTYFFIILRFFSISSASLGVSSPTSCFPILAFTSFHTLSSNSLPLSFFWQQLFPLLPAPF